ncbi:MAG: acyltransferase family protein [Candidatus Dojkabacteria bacterium]
MQPQKKPRNPFLDIIKGGLIILVVVGHLIQTNIPNFDDNLFFRLIYSFHMPMFIGISGYVAFISMKDEPFFKKIKKRFLALVVPFLSWYFIYGYLVRGTFRTIDIRTYIIQLIKSPDYGLWFLWILFLCFVVLFLIKEFERIPQTIIKKSHLEKVLIVGTILYLYLIHYELLGIGLLKWHFPSFIIGYLIAEHIEFFKKYTKLITEGIFVGYPTLLFFWNRVKDPRIPKFIVNFLHTYVWIVPTLFRYIVALLGSIFFVTILYKITNQRIKDILEFLGNNTLDIYVIHFNLLGFVGIMGIVGLESSALDYISIALCTIIVLSLSIFISKYIIRQSTLLSTLFLGGRN